MAQVTKKDIKEAVGEKVEKEFLASAEKRVKSVQKKYYTDTDEIIDLCPYCNENRNFMNPKIIKNIDGEPHLVLSCPVCKNTVYAHFHLIEDGDIFSGYSYECVVTMKKSGEAEKKPYHVLSLGKANRTDNV